ncbi:hypothetical protein Lal_00012771 [Lupinus albus]|nr:hypothetical protein Lal_00012771 [Lupinus albus]
MDKDPKIGGSGVDTNKPPNANTRQVVLISPRGIDLPYVVFISLRGIDLPYVVLISLRGIDLPYVVLSSLRGIDLPYVVLISLRGIDLPYVVLISLCGIDLPCVVFVLYLSYFDVPIMIILNLLSYSLLFLDGAICDNRCTGQQQYLLYKSKVDIEVVHKMGFFIDLVTRRTYKHRTDRQPAPTDEPEHTAAQNQPESHAQSSSSAAMTTNQMIMDELVSLRSYITTRMDAFDTQSQQIHYEFHRLSSRLSNMDVDEDSSEPES